MTLRKIEDDLHRSYSKILAYRFNSDTIAWDSLEFENKIFREKIGLYTSKYPLTLAYRFDLLRKDDIDIVTSGDKLLKIYSWDTWLGGTEHHFVNVFQYKSGDKVYSKVSRDTTTWGLDEYTPYYSDIFSLRANGKTYYVAVNNGIYSTKDVSESVKIFCIENNSLNDTVKLIKTETGLQNEINVYFDFFSVVDRPERPLRLIKYDPLKKIIYIPIIYEDDKVSNRFILYQFTGQYFKKVLQQKKVSK
jgi:hypothetical protein